MAHKGFSGPWSSSDVSSRYSITCRHLPRGLKAYSVREDGLPLSFLTPCADERDRKDKITTPGRACENAHRAPRNADIDRNWHRPVTARRPHQAAPAWQRAATLQADQGVGATEGLAGQVRRRRPVGWLAPVWELFYRKRARRAHGCESPVRVRQKAYLCRTPQPEG